MQTKLATTVMALVLCFSSKAHSHSSEDVLEPLAKMEKKLVYSDSFEHSSLYDPADNFGQWRSTEKQVKNGNKIQLDSGVLQVEHRREIKHPLGIFLDLTKDAYLRDTAVLARFRFLRDDQELTIGFTGDNNTAGHKRICMFTAKPDGFKISDATGKGHHEFNQVETRLAPNQWHNVLLVVRGQQCQVFLNGVKSTQLDSKGLACEKHTLKLGTSTGFEVDQLTVWSLAEEGDNRFMTYAPSRSSNALIVVASQLASEGLSLEKRQTIALGFPAATIARNAKKRLLYLAAAKSRETGGADGAVVRLDGEGNYKNHARVKLRHGYCYLSLDRTKRFLLGVDYSGGHVDVYAIDDHGMPSKCVASLNENRRNAHCVLPSLDNRFVYIPYVKDTNALFQYSFDAKTGALTPLEPKNVEPPKGPEFPEGTGPRHMAYHPSRPIVYFSNEQLPGASVYQIANSGNLDLRQICRAFEKDQDLTGLSSSDIAITPDGWFLFVGVRGHRQNLDRIARFRVLVSGELELLGLTPADAVPWGMTLSPSGEYLLVTAFRGATLTAYAIGENGDLSIADQLAWDQQISDLVAAP